MPKNRDIVTPDKAVLPAPKPIMLPAFLERSRMLDVHQFAAVLGFSVAHTRRLYQTGKLPAPVRINGRKVGWPAHVAAKLVGAPEAEAA